MVTNAAFYLGRYYQMQAMHQLQVQSVASVHVPIKLLTDKERTRHLHVMALVEAGKNPYNAQRMKDDGKNLGGGLEKIIDYTDRIEIDEAEHTRLEKRWQTGVEGTIPPAYLDFSLEGMVEPHPDKVICHFCHAYTDRITSTQGSISRKTYKDEVVDYDGVKTIETLIIHRADKVSSCPDCVLHFKKVDREGKITYFADIPNTD